VKQRTIVWAQASVSVVRGISERVGLGLHDPTAQAAERAVVHKAFAQDETREFHGIDRQLLARERHDRMVKVVHADYAVDRAFPSR